MALNNLAKKISGFLKLKKSKIAPKSRCVDCGDSVDQPPFHGGNLCDYCKERRRWRRGLR